MLLASAILLLFSFFFSLINYMNGDSVTQSMFKDKPAAIAVCLFVVIILIVAFASKRMKGTARGLGIVCSGFMFVNAIATIVVINKANESINKYTSDSPYSLAGPILVLLTSLAALVFAFIDFKNIRED